MSAMIMMMMIGQGRGKCQLLFNLWIYANHRWEKILFCSNCVSVNALERNLKSIGCEHDNDDGDDGESDLISFPYLWNCCCCFTLVWQVARSREEQEEEEIAAAVWWW